METSALATVIPLVGVALGAVSTFFGQYIALRGQRRDRQEELIAAARAETRRAILSFLSAAQDVEREVSRMKRGLARRDEIADELIGDLWLAKKTLELVSSPELSQCAHDYTSVLESLVWDSVSSSAVQEKRERRWRFMEAARHEVGAGVRSIDRWSVSERLSGKPLAPGNSSPTASVEREGVQPS
ncbi:hypothetical protein ACWT_3696 [Actinoplanes sp. SE50]|uniref:hypothetical protein n=1 Tax=unclassified Actinoplanes TaxID=2626549 RepID=UPI00023EC7CF|nr:MULTISPECIES: hypothetical protein [unclassified Actinoplanes]AEV84719.1 hypothetical protein ACPL_3824 [Actinoplanes sp. SE50/110]ATO83111.1 hypothetical protein ACWT_3696 [Actinoplanes sp. SE50]SLM00518.1 hypothetical protein ACSP50_3751 [Actinoplanes sp. SE50/110]